MHQCMLLPLVRHNKLEYICQFTIIKIDIERTPGVVFETTIQILNTGA